MSSSNETDATAIHTTPIEYYRESRIAFRSRRSWCSAVAQLFKHAHLTIKITGESPKQFLILPAGARRATPSEQRAHSRPDMLVIKAIAPSQATEIDAKKFTLYFSFPSQGRQVLTSWLQSITEESLQRIAIAADLQLRPIHAPLLKAWGHIPSLPKKEIPSIIRSLNFKMGTKELEKAYEALFGRKIGSVVSCKDFIELKLSLAVNDTVKQIAKQVTDGELRPLTCAELAQVLQIQEEQAKALLNNHNETQCPLPLLTYLLYHPSNTCIEETKRTQMHDMTKPLNQYHISSSHNTYLTGDQLQSNSSANMYRYVLEKGCRCVEIDAWDGDEGTPVVYHGKTMTSRVSLEDVLKAISDNAFAHGFSYPVIVSIENHLELKQQVIAAKLIREIFGDTLATPETHGPISDALPSPEKLMNKVIIKAKTGYHLLNGENDGKTHSELESESGESFENLMASASEETKPSASTKLTEKLSPRSWHCHKPSTKKKEEKEEKKEKKTIKIAPELAELVLMPGGNRKELLAMWKEGKSGVEEYIPSICISVSEKKIEEVVENNLGESFRKYNDHAFSRVYPKANRINSSNYPSTVAQLHGCQIIAMNWQEVDTPLATYQARFVANQSCGYILKSSIREPDVECTLRFGILSAFLLPNKEDAIKKDTADSYCTVKLFDTEYKDADDCLSFQYSTQVAGSDGFAPAWNETTDIKVKNRSFAILHLKVYDKDVTSEDDPIGYTAIPLSLLRTGIRSFPLNSMEGEPLEIQGATLRPALLCSSTWL